MPILHLIKDSDDLVSFCKCEQSVVGAPMQLDCPWCGCGWLFSCKDCGLAFAFAKAVMLDTTWEEIAESTLKNTEFPYKKKDVKLWAGWLEEMCEDLEEGHRYVYFDGAVIDCDYDDIEFEGQYAAHELDFIPQVAALKDPKVKDEILENPEYWMERRLEEEDEE